MAVCNGVEDGQVAIDRLRQVGFSMCHRVVDEADAAIDGVQGPQRVLKESLIRRRKQNLVDAPVEQVEFAECDLRSPLAKGALHMQHLIAMGKACPLHRQPDDESLHIPAQLQQQALPRKIDRRNPQPVARQNHQKRIGGEAAHGVVHRGAAKPGQVLQLLQRELPARFQLAIDQQFFDALIGEVEEIDAVRPPGLFAVCHQFGFRLLARHLRSPPVAVNTQYGIGVKHVVKFYKHDYCPDRGRLGGLVSQSGNATGVGRAEEPMKITSVETLRTEEFANVLWVRIHTDAGIIGLGETFYGAGAVEAHIHDVLAGRLLGRDPMRIEAHSRELVNLPMAQASTGAEYRAASAIDLALWDIFGKVCNQPVHQMLGGLCHDRIPVYNTCAGYGYVRSNKIKPVDTWNFRDDAEGPYEDLRAFMTDAGALAENLLEQGISAMKIWPFDPAAIENDGRYITSEQLRAALLPFEQIRKRVGDRMRIMVEFHSLWNLPTIKRIARELEAFDPTWYEDPIRMNSVSALSELAASTTVPICASETLGSRFPYKDMLEAGAIGIVMTDLVWTGGLTEGRKIASLADTYHRPYAPHDCTGPVAYAAAVHSSFSQTNTMIQESVRAFYTGWYSELVTNLPVIENGFVLPMEGPGLGTELLPKVFERPDLTVRVSEI